jgi:hypothetical protein
MKPFPNRTSAFQRIRLSPDSPNKGRDIHEESYRWPSATLSTRLCHKESAQALRPAAALPAALGGRDSTGYYGLSARVPTLAISQPTLWESEPVPALLMSQVLCCRRCPLDPLTWRTTLGASLLGYKALEAPALPYVDTPVAAQGVGLY